MTDTDLARILWHFHQLHHELVKSDCILALGSHDLRVAERAAELYHAGWAPLVVFSGGLGRLTDAEWNRPEAQMFAEVALRLGVPEEKILREDRSTNTAENIQFTRALLKERGLDPASFILIQKPYMERRAGATFRKHWPDKPYIVTSPQIPFEAYPTQRITREDMIHIMVGDLQRLRVYTERGWIDPEPVPDDVWAAYEELVERGYTEHLVRD